MSEIEVTDDVEDVPTTAQKFAAELLGTLVLVLGGVGTAIISQGDYVATGLAFGLSVIVMAYAFGRVSGGHFNPAITLGAALGGRLPWRAAPIYVGAQLVGALLAGAILLALLEGIPGGGLDIAAGANSFGDDGSGYAWWAALLLEILLTAIFLFVVLGVTDARNEFQAFMGPLAIGLALTLIHFISMPATGTSVNPARSIGIAVYSGTDPLIQLWLFIVAPLVGAAIAGVSYPLLFGHGGEPVEGSGLNFSRSKSGDAAWAPPHTYEQQWNQGQPQQWQPGPQQGQPHGQPLGQPQGQPLGQQPGQPLSQQPGQPQGWGQAPAQGQGWGQPSGQPTPMPPTPPADQQGWGQTPPSIPPAAAPQQGAPVPVPPHQQDAPNPASSQPGAPFTGGPQHWGQPGGDEEDGRTQVRPSE